MQRSLLGGSRSCIRSTEIRSCRREQVERRQRLGQHHHAAGRCAINRCHQLQRTRRRRAACTAHVEPFRSRINPPNYRLFDGTWSLPRCIFVTLCSGSSVQNGAGEEELRSLGGATAPLLRCYLCLEPQETIRRTSIISICLFLRVCSLCVTRSLLQGPRTKAPTLRCTRPPTRLKTLLMTWRA
jgi:hypothetical protein